jgi:diacylglycerol O-acyltransferase
MTSLASLYGRSNLASRVPAAGNVAISNVPGPSMTLYMAGAKMVGYYPVSIPYHGMALNITVHSYAGTLEFGLTACRRALSQDESYELIGYLRDALDEIRRLPIAGEEADAAASTAEPAAGTMKKLAKPRAPAAKSVAGKTKRVAGGASRRRP